MMTFRSCLTALSLFACAVPALAAQVLEVEVDKSRMLTISGTPGAIVIGNPSIADVTSNGDKIFVHGRNFGETNLLILDLQGNTIAEFDLITRHVNNAAMAIYKGSTNNGVSRSSYSCYPLCESDMQVGDNVIYFKTLIEEASDKTKFATGSETSEAQAPAAPQ
jgi:Pilus formation protein N terminal region